jgi:hypothetical protein
VRFPAAVAMMALFLEVGIPTIRPPYLENPVKTGAIKTIIFFG